MMNDSSVKKGVMDISDLDSSQRAFCFAEDRFIRLLAPAGAGKTLALLYRCKKLIELNPNERILLFTFTRVARDVLKIRLRNDPAFQKCSNNITISTLNSYGMRIVRNKSNILSSFRVIENKERIWAVQNYLAPVIPKSKILEKLMADRHWRAFNARLILDFIDNFKSLGFDHEKLISESDFNAYWNDLSQSGLHLKLSAFAEDLRHVGLIKQNIDIYRNFFRFYIAATEQLKGMNLYTLEDQKYWGWKYSEKGTKLTGAARYAHIMVDEFQDVNPIDLLFVKTIRNQHDASLVLVGDDDQTIFEWRGATPQYILQPEKYLSSVRQPMQFKTYVLDRNYRSPKNIVEMSQKLIQNNVNRVKKSSFPVRTDLAKINIRTINRYDDTVNWILEDWENSSVKNVAVISRKRSRLIPYQILLASRGVSFFAAEDLNIFLTEAFNSLKDLLEIKQIYNESNAIPFTYWNKAIPVLCDRIRKYPMNKKQKEALQNYMLQIQLPAMESAVDHLSKMPNLNSLFPKQDICSIIEGFMDQVSVADMMGYVRENFLGLQKDFRKADDDIFYADPPFAELAEFSHRYGDSFRDFYLDVQKTVSALTSCIDMESEEITAEKEQAIGSKLQLMTALRTKGKEFDSVFILEANQGEWPIRLAETSEELEAERRLFYVAVTRARQKLNFIVDHSIRSPYLQEMGLA